MTFRIDSIWNEFSCLLKKLNLNIKRLNIDRNESDALKYSHEIEYLVTSCMMSKSNEIRLESYSTILKLVTVSE